MLYIYIYSLKENKFLLFHSIDLCKVQDNKTFQGQPQDLRLCQVHFFFKEKK